MIKLCDIYSDVCDVCGTIIPMHLGDFDTISAEIKVVCSVCMPTYKTRCKRYVTWHYEDNDGEGIVRVYSLTGNAWKNRSMNHPNFGHVDKIDMVDEESSIYFNCGIV